MEESTLIRKNAIRWVRQNFDISQNASKLHNPFIQATQKPYEVHNESGRVSILISMYEQLEMTLNCIKCIRQTLDGVMEHEIILVDDASSRKTQESLRAIVSPPDKLILNSRARSFAYNNNIAAKSASGAFLCFLNNDVIVQGDCFLRC